MHHGAVISAVHAQAAAAIDARQLLIPCWPLDSLRLQFVLQVEVTYRNGTHVVVAQSDDNWKVGASPTLYNNIYLGVRYDARLETPGWDLSSFNDSTWGAPVVIGAVGSMESGVGHLSAQQQPPVRRQGTVLMP